MKPKPVKPIAAVFLLGAALAIPLPASAETIAQIEQFRVSRGSLVSPGSTFNDPFSDGVLPPSGPILVPPLPSPMPALYPADLGLPAPPAQPPAGSPFPSPWNVYGVSVAPSGLPLIEANDQLTLDSSKGNPSVNAFLQARRVSSINLLTDTTLGGAAGLRQSSAFVVSAGLALTPLNAPNDFQALYLSDLRRTNQNDPLTSYGGNLLFGPFYDPTDGLKLGLIGQHFPGGGVTGTRTTFAQASFTPPAGADGITLLLEHVQNSNTVYAYYRYYDDTRGTPGGGLIPMGPLQYFGTAEGALFNNGADWTRAGISISQAVPEPETYAMLLAGLGLLGAVARRRKQKEASA